MHCLVTKRINNAKYVAINKLLSKIPSAFYLGFGRERAKRRFLISDISAVNMTMYRGQIVAREL
jgi:hypothetical protein